MKDELYFYDIYPKIVLENQQTEITVKPLSAHVFFEENGEYLIQIFPLTSDIYSDTKPPIAAYTVIAKNGTLSFNHAFIGEQEHYIRIFKKSEPTKRLVQLSVYSLQKDLWQRRPYKGDFHVHSFLSDGVESPEFVASMYRQAGFDFMAITDHGWMGPSLRAIDAYKDVHMDFVLYPGEEIHAPKNHIHILNFGGDFSVNARCHLDHNLWAWKPNLEWMEKTESAAKDLSELPDGVDPYVHASCLEIFRQIKEANGLSIFCHPHWLADVYNVTNGFTKFYLENGFADAFELLNGGNTMGENNTQLAFWHDVCTEGYQIPVVGSSDSHGTANKTMFNEAKTIVFAHANTRDDIINAVKGQYSVPVEEYAGEPAHLYGSYRMVSYGIFLYHHYFPLHDELCAEEGLLMRKYINHENAAKENLERLKGQTTALMEKYFSK